MNGTKTQSATYADILAELEALVSEGLAFVTDNDYDYAVAHEEYHDVEITLEVTSNWDYQYTLIAGSEARQTRNITEAAHALHYATNTWTERAAEIAF